MIPKANFIVGDRVTCDFHHGIPATVKKLVGDGFEYVLDRPHDLGPRHGFITNGTAFTADRWRHIDPQVDWPEEEKQRLYAALEKIFPRAAPANLS